MIWLAVFVVLVVLALLCANIARLHYRLAFHAQTINLMLRRLDPEHPAHMVAEERLQEAIRLGYMTGPE